MTELTVATAALQILNNALGVMKATKERAKVSQDIELKESISAMYDELLGLKEALMRLTDENTELRSLIKEMEAAQAAPEEKPELKQVGDTNYYFVGEKGPYCQVCFDGKGKLVGLRPLSPTLDQTGSRRDCPLCKETFYEKRPVRQSQVGGSGGRGGPQGWMGS